MISRLCFIILVCCSSALAAGQKSYSVSGDSMFPALSDGDSVTVEIGPGIQLQRGDLVSIRIGADSHPMIKRIVAVEGDRVEFKEGEILVNGQKTGAFDQKRWQATVRQLERSDGIVPPGFLFILGDNPSNSRDSKRLGLISISQVEGRVVRVDRKVER
jgi:signal peptidase I